MNAASIQAELLQHDPTRVRVALQAIRTLDASGRAELAEGVTRALHELERALTDAGDGDLPPGAFDTVFLPFVAAALRLREAHGVIARLLGSPAQKDELWGDTVTEDAAYILADTFDGNLDTLRGLLFNDEAYVYARDSVLKTLAVLLRRGELPREAVASLLTQVTDHVIAKAKEPMDDEAREDLAYFATNIPCDAADMGLSELTGVMARIPQAGLWDDFVDDADQVFAQLERGEAEATPRDLSITDVWEHVRDWDWFEDQPDRLEPQLRAALPSPLPPPVRRDTPKVGRNDPCPCGSGKKFKKCCGA